MKVPVNDYISKKNKNFYVKELHDLEVEKAKIAKLIIMYRTNKKLSQTKLAKKVGVTQQHISKIENGEFSSIATLAKVLLALGYFLHIKPVKLTKKIAPCHHAA